MAFRRDVKQLLRSESAEKFRTQRILLDNRGHIIPFGTPLTFTQMQAYRQRGEVFKVSGGEVFANLGVSLQLIVHHKGRKALVLVQQEHRLKLISGYVPKEHLGNPLQTVWMELMEEVLPITASGKLYGFACHGRPLEDPYSLGRDGSLAVGNTLFLPGWDAIAHTFQQTCDWPVTSYRDPANACLQLVFPVEVRLPKAINLYHAEDVWERSSNRLLSEFDPQSHCVLMALDENDRLTGDMYTLKDGDWLAFDSAGLVLSEFFDHV